MDNGNFDVNQQNKPEYTGAAYTVDRWQMSINRGKLNVNDGYVTLTNTSATGAQYFRQPFEVLFKEGDILTLAVMLRGNGQGQMFLEDSETGANIGGGLSFTPTNDWKVYIKTIKIGNKIPKYFTLACVGENAHFDIKCAKTEYGSYFTGWPVWNYAQELAKCQRYRFHISRFCVCASNNNGSALDVLVPLPVTMRTIPVCEVISMGSIYFDGISYEPSKFTYSQVLISRDCSTFSIRFLCAERIPAMKTGLLQLDALLSANL